MSARIDTQVRAATNLVHAFFQAADKHGSHPALKANGGKGHSYTYDETRQLVRRLAAGLGRPEWSQAKQIGILSENRPEWGIAYLAVLAAGRTVVPIDAALKPLEIAFILNDAGVDLLFASDCFETQTESLREGIRVFSFEPGSPRSWSRLMTPSGDVSTQSVGDTAVLIYTSGTTGRPKAVELTHRNLLSNLDGIKQALQFGPQDTFLSVLPLHHTFEATCGLLTPLLSGACVVYARSLKSKEILEDIAANGVTLMCGVPLLYEKMYHSIRRSLASAPLGKRLLFRLLFGLSSLGWTLGARWGKKLFAGLRVRAGLASMRMFVSGGAALPPQISRFFNLIGFDFCQGYGLTECSPVISTNRPGDIKFGSVGPPLRNLEVITDSPDGNGIGEIIVRGDAVTPGYRNSPEKSAETVVDGWLRTGDLGRFHRGHLWITGRKKNIIVSAAGKNIYPEELEEKLLESSCILEAVVFGRKKQGKQGEEVQAVIVPDMAQLEAEFSILANTDDLTKVRPIISAVVNDLNGRVAAYKRISGFEVQLKELEKTSTKKVKRFLYQE